MCVQCKSVRRCWLTIKETLFGSLSPQILYKHTLNPNNKENTVVVYHAACNSPDSPSNSQL